MSLPSRLLGANPSIQVSSLLSGSLTTPSAKGAFTNPADYDAIQTVTSNGSATSFDFTSIPQTYTYLEIRGFGSATGASYRNVALRFNGDSGSNYNWRVIWSNNNSLSGANTNSTTEIASVQSFPFGTQMGSCLFMIDNYTSTTKAKTVLSYGGASQSSGTTGEVSQGLGTWYGTPAAITSISVLNAGANTWTSGTTFTLYGIV